jgi:hypothetical protein
MFPSPLLSSDDCMSREVGRQLTGDLYNSTQRAIYPSKSGSSGRARRYSGMRTESSYYLHYLTCGMDESVRGMHQFELLEPHDHCSIP